MTAKPEQHWLNTNQMAASIGVSRQALHSWGVLPVAHIGKESFYTVQSVLENRLAHLEAKLSKTDPAAIENERLRLTKEQADNMAIKNEQARGKLVPIELLTLIVSRVAGEWAGQCDTLVPNIVRRFPGLDSQLVEFIKLTVVRMQNTVARLDEVTDDVVTEYTCSLE